MLVVQEYPHDLSFGLSFTLKSSFKNIKKSLVESSSGQGPNSVTVDSQE